jgi:hypothetical protein
MPAWPRPPDFSLWRALLVHRLVAAMSVAGGSPKMEDSGYDPEPT